MLFSSYILFYATVFRLVSFQQDGVKSFKDRETLRNRILKNCYNSSEIGKKYVIFLKISTYICRSHCTKYY